MSSDDTNIISFQRSSNADGTFDRKQIPSLLQAVRKLLLARLDSLLSGMLDNVDDALFELVEKAESATQQSLYFDTMRLIRVQRESVAASFNAHLGTEFDLSVKNPNEYTKNSKSQNHNLDEFSLVEHQDLEEELAVKGMTNKARARYDGILAQLDMRFRELLQIDEDSSYVTPLDPDVITNAFEAATIELEVELKLKLIIFKLFDKYVMTGLSRFYEEVNQLFIQAGVLPGTITRRSPGSKQPGNPAQSSPDDAAVNPRQNDPNNVVPIRDGSAPVGGVASNANSGAGNFYGSNDVFGVIQQLLGQQKGPPGLSGANFGDLPTADQQSVYIPTDDLLQALSTAQQQTTARINWAEPSSWGRHAMLPPQQLKELIVKEYAPASVSGQGQLNQHDDDVIDVVSLLFEYFLNDKSLPEPIKVQLGRLQIPYVKLAVIDKTLFSNKRHPARLLLNEIAQIGLSVNVTPRLKSDKIFSRIDAEVNRIQEEFTNNPELFSEILGEFRDFCENEQARAKVVEERTKQAAEGKARVDRARAQIDSLIQEHVGQKILPEIVNKLLKDAWSKVLFITYLKDGDKSPEWTRQVNLVDELISSVELKDNKQDRDKVFSAIPGLLQELREGLNGILYNPSELAQLFSELEACHERCLQQSDELIAQIENGDMPDTVAPVKSVKTDDVGEILDKVWEKEQVQPKPKESVFVNEAEATAAVPNEQPVDEPADDPRLAEYVAKLEKIKLETWFDVWDVDKQERQRGKLVARLLGGDKLIFVSRAGIKVAEKRLHELANEVMLNQSMILDDSLLFDKALESVIDNLRSLREKNPK